MSMFAETVGVARATITKAEGGLASADTYSKLEHFLNKLDEERDMDTRSAQGVAGVDLTSSLDQDVIEIEVTGPSTRQDWHVVFRAHPEHVDLITEQASKLLRQVESDD